MRAEKVIKHLLSADAAVAAIVGTRIYGGASAEGATTPLLVYYHVDSGVDSRASAVQKYVVNSEIEVLAVAKTYEQLKSLNEAVRQALLYKGGDIAGVTVNTITWSSRGEDQYDAERREFAQSVTYRVSHMEP